MALQTAETAQRWAEQMQKVGESFDLIGDHMIVTDSDANVLYANKGVERATGFPINEVLGQNPGKLWGGRMPKKFYEEIWHTIKDDSVALRKEIDDLYKQLAELRAH